MTVLAASGCRCRSDTTPVTPQLKVAPAALDFGEVAIGASVPLTLELSNGGGADGVASLSVTGPFALETSSITVSAGAVVKVTVTFVPTRTGPESAAVQVFGVGEVSLTGNGLPACVASAACRSSHFDLQTRTCVEASLAEGTACSAPCLKNQGACRGGFCLGEAATCVDGDPCTLDVCSADGGCLHPPVVCPIADRCQAQFCDPLTGCGTEPVDDGTACGDATCEEAHVCFGGSCQARSRPNALLDCRYTTLQAGYRHTCAVTRGGNLRCWGDNTSDQLGRGYLAYIAPPGFAVGVSNARSVAISGSDDTTWVGTSGGVRHLNRLELLAIDASALACDNAAESDAGFSVCGIEQGVLRCGSFDGGPLVTVTTDVSQLSSSLDQLCVVHFDGGLACGTPTALAPISLPGPATDVAAANAGSGCALVGDQGYCWGAPFVEDGGAQVLWDAGVGAIAAVRYLRYPFGPNPGGCASTADGIRCTEAVPSSDRTEPGNGALIPPAVVPSPRLIALTLGAFHGCGLGTDGQIRCWGDNYLGQLGERTSQPLGLQRLPYRADWLGHFGGQVVFSLANSPVRTLGTPDSRADGGVLWGFPHPTTVDGSPASYGIGCPCDVDAGVGCGQQGPVPLDGAQACGAVSWASAYQPLCVARSGGDVRCYNLQRLDAGVAAQWNAGGEIAQLAGEVIVGGACAVRTDGQVRCNGVVPGNQVAQSLTHVKDLCFGNLFQSNGCARLDTGELRCWGEWVGSATPKAPDGAWPVARQVSCGTNHVCELSGTNIVRCWGDNSLGQLGRDGPSSTIAASIPMPGPVVSIAAGQWHTCALLQTGDVYCWGSNLRGELGVPLLMRSYSPVVVTQ